MGLHGHGAQSGRRNKENETDGIQDQNYRSIRDSGWVKVDDIAAIVGKNESGKTSLLKALWKFNPYDESGYQIDREWPRGHRKESLPTRP